MAVDGELGKPQDLTAQVKRVPEPRLLSFLGGEGFHWLQIEIVIQMQII